MTGLHAGSLASLPETTRKDPAAVLSPAEARALLYDWSFWARPAQLPPSGNWRVWLLLAGAGLARPAPEPSWCERGWRRGPHAVWHSSHLPQLTRAMSWSKAKAAS